MGHFQAVLPTRLRASVLVAQGWTVAVSKRRDARLFTRKNRGGIKVATSELVLTIEAILFRRVLENRIAGYTVATAEEIARATMDLFREPTEAMLKAGEDAYWRKQSDMLSPTPTEEPGEGAIGYAYRAMVKAALEETHDRHRTPGAGSVREVARIEAGGKADPADGEIP
jgi:hypothetical protein